jgi:superfamily I DNA/RNA helicase
MEEFVIRRGDVTFEPSSYQKDILKFAKYGDGNCFIEACAGASKTTMLENIMYVLPETHKKLFIAFNKSIAEEMKNRISGVDNVKICTYHSLGFDILRENFPDKDFIVDVDKYKRYLRENILTLTSFGEIDSLGVNKNTYLTNIVHLIEYARYYHKSHVIHIRNIAEEFNLIIQRDEPRVVQKILEWGKNNTQTIDYTDMIWLVNEFNLTTRRLLFNHILIDEAQDTSVMQKEMVERCAKRGARYFIVGDEHQSINVWCGSDMDAVRKFKDDKCKVFTLPISYRCAKKIVDIAKKYSPDIIAANNAIEGEINYNVPYGSPKGSDMVLCRNTAPLIEYYLKLLKINKKCYIKGQEGVLTKYIGLIEESNATLIDKECLTFDGLIPKLYEKLLINYDKLIENGYTSDEAYHHDSIINLYDDIIALIALSDCITTTEELVNKIKTIFSVRDVDGIMLTTVHKAKGLEADNVFILEPSLLPSKFVTKEWEIKSEQHLVYVAYTRAKKTLNFIEENTKKFNCGAAFNYKKMKENIEGMRLRLNFNIENGVSEGNISEKITNLTTFTPKVTVEIKTGDSKKPSRFSNMF